jgi:hypothetical protein
LAGRRRDRLCAIWRRAAVPTPAAARFALLLVDIRRGSTPDLPSHRPAAFDVLGSRPSDFSTRMLPEPMLMAARAAVAASGASLELSTDLALSLDLGGREHIVLIDAKQVPALIASTPATLVAGYVGGDPV